MVTIPREAIKDQLEKLPADKNRLFDALKIEKLPHLLGRSGDDLNPTQMGEIHLFFLSVPAHTAAIAADEGYATGRADDLTRVLAGLPPQNIKDVTELPNICKTIGKLYVPRLIKKIQAQIAAAGVVNALALEGILKKRGAGEKLSSDETRLLLWSYAIGESCKQLASVPRDPNYCPDECKEIERINELETVKSWAS